MAHKIRLGKRRSKEDIIFDSIVYIIIILICMATILPCMQVLTISLSPNEVAGKYGLHLFPVKISLEGFKKVLEYPLIWTSYGNTITRSLLGTFITQVLLVLGAYPLAKPYLPNRKLWTILIIFTMYFSGGIVPDYLLVVKYLKLKNTIWSLVLPGAVNAYTLIIVRNFFEGIPASLEESARIDGASEMKILLSIVLPLSKPVLATTSLWSLVYHWNSWFDCMLYIPDQSKYVLQMVLRNILIQGQIQDVGAAVAGAVNNETMKMATLVVSVIPIIAIYPFLQKYFVQGVMVGAVKE